MKKIIFLLCAIALSSNANGSYIPSIEKIDANLERVETFVTIKLLYFNQRKDNGESHLYLQWLDPINNSIVIKTVPIMEINGKFRFNVYETKIKSGKPTIYLSVGTPEGEELGDAEVIANYNNPGEYTFVKHY